MISARSHPEIFAHPSLLAMEVSRRHRRQGRERAGQKSRRVVQVRGRQDRQHRQPAVSVVRVSKKTQLVEIILSQ